MRHPQSAIETRDPQSAIEALYRISSVLGKTEDETTALRTILAEIITVFNASSGSIALLNPDTGRLEIEVQQGLPTEIDEGALRLGQGITGWVAFHGKPQLVPDVSADPRYVRLRPAVRCEMAAPMIEDGGQVLGVVNLDNDTLAAFIPADLDLLVRLTTEATAVIQRLWQLHQFRGKARQLEALITVGQSLVTKLEQQELLDTVTEETRKIIQARACAFYLYDSGSKTVRLAALAGPATVSGAPALSASKDELALDSCLVASALVTRRQVEFYNIQAPEFFDLIDLPRDPELRSVLVTPMIAEGDALGALAIFTGQVHRFNNDEKRLTAALASLAAVALQNARLYARVFHSEESLRKNEQFTTLGLLAAEIAHEIRNPLTVIKLLFGALDLEFSPDDPRRTDERLIREKLDQLEDIVTRVLSFAKAPSTLHSRWSVAEIVTDTLMLVRIKAAQSKVQLHFDPPPNPLIVDVHKGQLQQVLLNLIFNSTQAMPDGGDITLRCSSDAQRAFIDVTDTGAGISEEIRDRVFDSFLSGRPDGTGLGLAIAKRIMLSHGGDITLMSTSPSGTTMQLTLPLAKN
ncbi:MAG: GAF domain-containing protein [Verrucomicrobiota bacterium]|nr:GAF domain-containing protein [Verrucomicrobiota bacterium]